MDLFEGRRTIARVFQVDAEDDEEDAILPHVHGLGPSKERTGDQQPNSQATSRRNKNARGRDEQSPIPGFPARVAEM